MNASDSNYEDRTLSLTASGGGSDNKYTSRSEQLSEPPRSFAWRLTGTSLTGLPEVLHRRRIVIESDKKGQSRRAPFCACSFLRRDNPARSTRLGLRMVSAAVGYVAVTFGRGCLLLPQRIYTLQSNFFERLARYDSHFHLTWLSVNLVNPYSKMPSIASSDHHAIADMRTVVVLGASYAGYTGAQSLSTLLPCNWRVVVIERNTHANRKTLQSHETKSPLTAKLQTCMPSLEWPSSRIKNTKSSSLIRPSSNRKALHRNNSKIARDTR